MRGQKLFTSDRSLYVEDSHFGGLSLDVAVVRDVRVNMGYRVLSTSGNRPLNYHQPYAGLVVPLNRRIAWTTEWRYYGYNERGAISAGFSQSSHHGWIAVQLLMGSRGQVTEQRYVALRSESTRRKRK